MSKDSMPQVRKSPLLNIATYLTATILGIIGLVIAPDTFTRVLIVILLIIFGLTHALVYQRANTNRAFMLYFAWQSLLVTGLLWLFGNNDVLNLLFFTLGVQVMTVFPTRTATAWIVVFYILSGLSAFSHQGSGALVTVIFNAAVYFFTAVYGYTLRQADLARSRNQQLLDELRATQDQLRELAVVEERNRLARDLHDSAKQQAFALSAQLDAVRSLIRRDPDSAETHVKRAEQLADSIRQELATLILELRPSALGSQGLAESIRQYVAEWSRQSSIEATVNVAADRLLATDIQHTLFRIIQESLANVARHSQAQHAEIELGFSANQIRLTIQDDGEGFDPNQIKAGIGTQSMRERAATLPNGRLTLDSAIGSGTRVIVECSA